MLLSLCFRATLYTYTYVRPHVVGTKWGHFKLPSITKKQNVEEYYSRPSVHPKQAAERSVIAVLQAPLVHDFEWWRNLWKDEWKLIWSSSENTRSPWLVFSPLMYWAEHNTNPDHYQIMGKTSLFLELHFSGDLIIGLQIRCIGGAPAAQQKTWGK